MTRIKNHLSSDEFRKFPFWRGKKFKYMNVHTIEDGIRFDSKREAEKYRELKILRDRGEIRFFLRQVPFDLPGGIRYKLDFLVVDKDGSLTFLEVKGFKTKEYILKKKQVEAIYQVQITEC